VTCILGVSAYYHDAAAALVVDGDVVAAAQEERFTRRKHDAGFPSHAIEYCLAQAGIAPEELDYVGFYEKPLLKFERLLDSYLACAPEGLRSFAQAIPKWLEQKLHLSCELRGGLKGGYRKRFVFAEHHESHAGSAFFPSPFEEAAILTLDGVGEWATAAWGHGRGNRITLCEELRFPHSLGLLYSAFTYFCGFRVNSGEHKLMGLAPYGKPRFASLILERLLDLKDDGSFRMNMRYFNYCQGLTMTSRAFESLFGGPPRRPETPLSQRELDLAASVQQVTEEIILRMARYVHARTGLKHLCLAGGVALNCVANGRVLREGPFERLWIQPASGDAGGALGVALFIWHQLLGRPREVRESDCMHGALLGPEYDDASVRRSLEQRGVAFHHYEDEEALCAAVAGHLAAGKVVGWLQNRMEFGPRALGSRSILGDPRSPTMQSVMNRKTKFRESFRPFAPAVLQERAAEYFSLRPGEPSPYMLLTASVSESQRRALSASEGAATGLGQLKIVRSTIPAVTHVDYSARVQTVDAGRHGRFHKLLKAFAAATGCPVLINTSFNVRGEPIVCSPEDAYRCFLNTNMDVLVVEKFVILKDEQVGASVLAEGEYAAQFQPD